MLTKHIARAATALIAFLVVLLYPDRQALAWGPGVHMAIGEYVLGNLGLLTPVMAEVLRSNGSAFLYGCLSADIFLGKGSTVHPTHSHNWLVGQKLLTTAASPRARAHALGYLSHLAADTVAHNYYVPNMLSAMPMAGRISHVYTEMLADSLVQWDRRKARRLLRQEHAEADSALLAAMRRKALPFVIKKRLVHDSLGLTGYKGLGLSMNIARRHFAPRGVEAYVLDMLELSFGVVVDFLRHPDTTPSRSLDPVGTRHLWSVRQILHQRVQRKVRLGRRTLGTLFPVETHLAAVPRPIRLTLGHAPMLSPTPRWGIRPTGTDG
ncbi:hypothetical protein GGQ74_003105 [Desulfobaculum xiamenense]|uniref:Phospholipase C/D domain-containing protein n=1 Tax=Desulfobaculum xiamenense TaxID=995050 RepID=A0A846QSR2_9BACT|nr:zinc dependent phospholipase C family protein [Desulfobaculum xiamenense]NJB69403.1 hypothetical protein [Desulfobaculum xiamenense]